MPRDSIASQAQRLSAHEGRELLWAHEALVKGAMESELELSLIVAPPREPFDGLHDLWADERCRAALRRHDLEISAVPRGDRAVTLARAAALSGGRAMAVVPNDDLGHALSALHGLARESLPKDAALCLLLEDDPRGASLAPREAAIRLQLPCLEPADVEQLRDAIEQSLRLSQAGRRAVALIVHTSILHSADTIPVWPNRALDAVDTVILRQTAAVRKARRAETGGLMRTARLFELNRSFCLPSPGERLPVGFIVLGPAYTTIRYLTHLFQLTGRVPLLHLRLLNPLDEAAVGRILTRCDQVIVLEPRPGVMESRLLTVAEHLRHRGERVGTVWGRNLPPDPSGEVHVIASHLDLHPSILARKIVHMLHSIRPTVQIASQLVPEPPRVAVEVAPRGAAVGFAAARAALLRLLGDLDRWVSSEEAQEQKAIPPSAIALDGVRPEQAPPRLIHAEIWEPTRFLEQGIPALRQAARHDQPAIFIIEAFGADDGQDLERIARAVVPAEQAERVRITLAGFADPIGLRDTLRAAALEDRVTVVVLADASPPRYDVGALERALAEIDRLGFEPRQQLMWPVEEAAAFRYRPGAEDAGEELYATPDRSEHRFTIDELPRRAGGRIRLGLHPLLEMVEVVRTRPPAQTWLRHLSSGLGLPEPLHGAASQWRAHVAGVRSRPPGPAAAALLEAGGAMGYAVSCAHDPAPISPGRRAWAQILFTHPPAGEAPPPLSAQIPFGEADLIIGLEPAETMRAVSDDPTLRVAYSDRTCAVVNSGAFSEDHLAGAEALVEALRPLLEQTCRRDHVVCEDVAGACRAWFRNERVSDVALLGIAFQRGYVPVTLEAMEAGIRRVEARGFARCMEAFQFGRRLAVDPRLLSRPKHDEEEELERSVRREGLLLRRHRFGGPGRAERYRRLMQQSLAAMPGLTETEAGRVARRDFVLAVGRCVVWGGLDYAQRYCDLITALYRVDRGEHGRVLTRCAILPLAEAMLIRDPMYILALATGPAQQRRTRQRLNVKRARGDQLNRRYISRLELVAMRRRIRLDARTSDGVARFVAWFRHIVPGAWRGTSAERDLRDAVWHVMSAAIDGAAQEFERWPVLMQALHRMAVDDRLRGLSAERLRRLLDEAAPPPRPVLVSRVGILPPG